MVLLSVWGKKDKRRNFFKKSEKRTQKTPDLPKNSGLDLTKSWKQRFCLCFLILSKFALICFDLFGLFFYRFCPKKACKSPSQLKTFKNLNTKISKVLSTRAKLWRNTFSNKNNLTFGTDFTRSTQILHNLWLHGFIFLHFCSANSYQP